MWFTDKFFGQNNSPKKRPDKIDAVVDLDLMLRLFDYAVPRIRANETRPALLRARLADGFRGVGLKPILPSEFDSETEKFDEEAWNRLALSITCLDRENFARTLIPLSEHQSIQSLIMKGFIHLARDRTALTMDLLYESRLRTEEFARHMAGELGLLIRGESAEESARIRHRLDYARLLKEAEEARLSASERIEYLRKLQEEEEAKRAPRGKW